MKMCKYCGNNLFEQRSTPIRGIVAMIYDCNGELYDAQDMYDNLCLKDHKYMYCNGCGKRMNFTLNQLKEK
jgi:hypothetical protein